MKLKIRQKNYHCADVYEISPYATFAVGGETAATLDHTLQFRTFGHRDNDAPPHRPCRKHPQRHRNRGDGKLVDLIMT